MSSLETNSSEKTENTNGNTIEKDEKKVGRDFIRTIIDEDIASGKHKKITTRFPPEPNGYLHLGHAKSIFLNFGIANEYNGTCHLRFDDTNPEKESLEYVESIKRDVQWLGLDWGENLFYASDYFEKLYNFALELIGNGKAYIDSSSAEEIRKMRGTLTEKGVDSPYRTRTVEENLALFEQMKNGEFADGEHVLRAKIDMSHANVILRDPTLYRIRHQHHHRAGDAWCIYPMYDFTHCISDSIEHITHSLCTLEFENNRALYDWVLDNISAPSRPHQYEFARLNVTYVLTSKRKLLELVENGYVTGWDDPRMPTISGIARRGFTKESIREFCSRVGLARSESLVDYAMLEFCLRLHLNDTAPRMMAVMNPLKVVIDNFSETDCEEFEFPYHPEVEEMGKRVVPFSREIYIDRDDFMEDAPKKYFRLSPGKEVRLRYAYYITCNEVIKDKQGEIIELRCTYDPKTRGGWSEDGRKVKGTLHWVSIAHAIKAEVRLYDHLFTRPEPAKLGAGESLKDILNPESLKVVDAWIEPDLANFPVTKNVQFERQGYFVVDKESTAEKRVFNRTTTLKDTWAKLQKKEAE